jgi:hypothetical protein
LLRAAAFESELLAMDGCDEKTKKTPELAGKFEFV